MTLRVRGIDDGKIVGGLTVDNAVAEFLFNSDTPLTVTTPTTATKVTTWSLGRQHVDVLSDANDTITIDRAGDRKVTFHLSEITKVNSQVAQAIVFKNGVATDIKDKFTNNATGVQLALRMEGILQDLKVGDVLDLRVVADTGSLVIGRARFVSEEI